MATTERARVAQPCLRHRMADAANDLLQDVFVKAMRQGQGQGFRTLDNPRAWLFQVARNALVDRHRTAHAHELPAAAPAGA